MTEILQTPKLVVVFGGSGFVGRHVVRALAKRGYRVRVACRRPDLAGHLQPLGNVGQIQPVQANLRVRWSVDHAVRDADHVINLVGILHESGRQTFNAVHEFGARAVAEAARAVSAGLTHMSALGADMNSGSAYAVSKARGEKAVLETIPGAVIMRPSINFGPEDDFFNRFASMARFTNCNVALRRFCFTTNSRTPAASQAFTIARPSAHRVAIGFSVITWRCASATGNDDSIRKGPTSRAPLMKSTTSVNVRIG